MASRLGPGLLVLAAAGCSGDPGDVPLASQSDAAVSVSELGRSAERNTLARTHDVTVDVDAGVLEEGYRAIQGQCDEMESCTILTSINFVVDQARGFWGTIGDAFADFGDALANGIASTTRGVAFILPWLVVVIPLL